MIFVVALAVVSGLGMSYMAIRMMKSREFVVWLSTAKWNPRARMWVRIMGPERYVGFSQKVVAPVLLVVSVGLWTVAIYLVSSGGK